MRGEGRGLKKESEQEMGSEVAAWFQMKRDPSTTECVPRGSTGLRKERWCLALSEGKYEISPVDCLSHTKLTRSCDDAKSDEECCCNGWRNLWEYGNL